MFGKKTWENTCNRCGLCCHEKVIAGDTVVYDLSAPCPHYDPSTHQCRIYNDRLRLHQECMRVTRFTAMFSSYLPETCAYVLEARRLHLRFAPKRKIYFARSHTEGDEESDSLKSQPAL